MASDITIIHLPCYSANGTVSSNDIQCNPDGKTSTCCAPGWQCVNNLYCRRGGVNKPGSCTDENWNQSVNPACSCPPRNDAQDYLSNTIMCSTESFLCTSDGDNEDHKATDCSDSDISLNPVIDYGNGLGVPTSTNTIALEAYYSGLAVSTATVPSRASTTKSSGSSNTSSATSSSATSTSTGFISTTPAGSGLSTSAKIGLGVAVGVGVPLLLLLATMLFLRVRQRGSNQKEGDTISLTKVIPSSPAPEYKAVEHQQIPPELSSDSPVIVELPGVRPPGELQTSPAELDTRYGHRR